MNTMAVIPARRASTRFPGKLLQPLGPCSVIEHTWRRACMGADRVVVATDDADIARVVTAAGGEAVMTPAACRNGTERCLLALKALGGWPRGCGAVVNVQGDEPFLDPRTIRALAAAVEQGAGVATAWHASESPGDASQVKVVADAAGRALYFSRAAIPHGARGYRIHQGIYAFGPGWLERCVQAPECEASEAESLEQLRWLHAGIAIATVEAAAPTVGIDTPADLALARKIYEDEHP